MPSSAAPGADASPPPEAAPDRPGNWPATAALIAGAAGFALAPIAAALVFAVVGLRRARRLGWRAPGSGVARSLAGLALAVVWAGTGIYLAPHLVRAFDPGCAAYKSGALGAYNKVIADFNSGGRAGSDIRALSAAASALRRSAARSGDPEASRAMSSLAAELSGIRRDIATGRGVPRSAARTLNRDAARADSACGTLRL